MLLKDILASGTPGLAKIAASTNTIDTGGSGDALRLKLQP